MKLIVNKLSFQYGISERRVFNSLSSTVTNFSRLALIGRSGSGKSTLIRLLGGALEPESGHVEIELRQPFTATYGYVHQEVGLLPWLSVQQNGRFGVRFHMRSGTAEKADGYSERLFNSFGLDWCRASLPKTLSGGMKQRLALVNALSSGANVLLLDEAFSASDVSYREAMFAELKAFAPPGGNNGIIFISHEIADVVELSDMVLCLPSRSGGQIEFIDARNGWTKSDRKRLAELMLGEAL